VALAAPLLVGLVRALKARLTGRRGPDPWQPYLDILKQLRKEAVISTTASWLFRLTPFVLVATMLVAATVVQTVTTAAGTGYTSRMITSPNGSLLEDRIVATTGSYSATAPLSGGSWVIQMVAFKAAP